MRVLSAQDRNYWRALVKATFNLIKEALAEVGDLKIGGRIINKVRFADDCS